MANCKTPAANLLRRTIPCWLTLACFGLVVSPVSAQNNNSTTNRAVGGISIDAKGLLTNAAIDSLGKLRQVRSQAMEPIPGEISDAAGLRSLRKVSLVRLDKAIRELAENGKPLTDAMKYLAGLQQIHYVFVYPEQHDIVLAGPGEGWKVDARGNMVGATTGRPVMLLDDLLVALRTAPQALHSGISCSIDPTPEGLARLREFASKLHTIGPNPQATVGAIQQTLGPQKITVSGVPTSSHFARVMVAADYRMKRIAMAFEPSPVRGLPSFLQMLSGTSRGMSSMLPRWWLAPEYQPLLRDASGTAWQLRGAAVKAMTEEDYVTTSGTVQHSGRANPVAQRWADMMTAKYDELSAADPIFGELRNCMELAVVAALVTKEKLPQKAGASLPTLLDSGRLEIDQFAVPSQVDSQASVLKKGNNWIISASGGVQIHAAPAVEKAQASDVPASLHGKAVPGEGGRWWWN